MSPLAKTHRGTSNRNIRGSSYDRRRLRSWMIETFGLPRRSDGKKTRIPCAHCGLRMRAEGRLVELAYLAERPELSSCKGLTHTWEVDRIVCGHDGGRYRRNNVVPACRKCNQTRCTKTKQCRACAPTSKKWRRLRALVQLIECGIAAEEAAYQAQFIDAA